MNTQRLHKHRRGLLAAFAACVLTCGAFACALFFPSQAQAEGTDQPGFWTHCYVEDSSGNKKYFDYMGEAATYACSVGNPVVVTSDDVAGEDGPAVTIPDGKSIVFNLNGHYIKNSPGYMFELGENSTLTLQSCDPDGKADPEGEQYASGVIYGCNQKGGINMKEGSHLILDHVTIESNDGGGIRAEKNCTIELKNKSYVSCNTTSDDGAGIYINGENTRVTLDNSKITGNKAKGSGGGIYIDAKGAVIDLKNGSTIDDNEAGDGGGGIYCNASFFTIKSSDGTGAIYGNKAKGSSRAGTKGGQSGGGIHVDAKSGENEGLIEGLLISNNYSAYDGGGLELDQRWTTVRNCTVTGNTCKYEGGGAYVCNNNVLFDNCTVTGNVCNLAGKNYEGGGVYVWCDYDLKLSGTCMIYDNARGQGGSADDVFLRENAGATAKAYITGSLSAGSKVGVRTGITGDRRIAKNFKSESKDALFIDLSGYYVSYGSDDGGDAWQRHRELAFALKVNGTQLGRYKYNEKVTLTAPAAAEGKTFWFWDTYAATGLYPIGDYINGSNCYYSPLTLTMPQNDVSFGAVYADTVKKARVVLQYPVAGEELSSTATIERTDNGFGGRGEQATVLVSWYEVATAADGSKTYAVAAGKAKPGTTYVARVYAAADRKVGLFYDASLSTETVRFRSKETGVSGYEAASASVSVDTATGLLTAQTSEFRTEGKPVEVKTAAVSVKMVNKGLLGSGAAASASIASLEEPLSLADDAEAQAEAGLIKTVEVTAALDDGSDEVSIAAPGVEGYNFCNWEGVPEGWVKDDVSGVVEVPVDQLGLAARELTAVYTPVVTAAKTDLAAPVAGEALATSVKDVTVSCSDGTQGQSLAELFGAGKGGFEVVWSPEGEGEAVRAAWSTAYTALIRLTDDVEGLEGVEDVLARDAVVTCDGTKATSAGFTVVDGYLCLAVGFDATPDVKATSVSQPADVKLTFEEAKACAETGEWQLPGTVSIELENGETVDGDVEWAAVEGFDAAAAGAQELTVAGKVTRVATSDDTAVDTSGVSLDVSATIKVAAPEDSASGDKKDDESGKKNDETKTDETKTASKKGTPSTGDVTYGGLAGLLALAVTCLAAARLSHRKN